MCLSVTQPLPLMISPTSFLKTSPGAFKSACFLCCCKFNMWILFVLEVWFKMSSRSSLISCPKSPFSSSDNWRYGLQYQLPYRHCQLGLYSSWPYFFLSWQFMNFTCPNTVTPAATQHSATIMLVVLNVSEVRDCRLKKALKIMIRKYRYQEENIKKYDFLKVFSCI